MMYTMYHNPFNEQVDTLSRDLSEKSDSEGFSVFIVSSLLKKSLFVSS